MRAPWFNRVNLWVFFRIIQSNQILHNHLIRFKMEPTEAIFNKYISKTNNNFRPQEPSPCNFRILYHHLLTNLKFILKNIRTLPTLKGLIIITPSRLFNIMDWSLWYLKWKIFTLFSLLFRRTSSNNLNKKMDLIKYIKK